MEPAEFQSKLKKPESKIQKDVIEYLLIREWFVRPVGPSAASCGWPDLFAAHFRYGPRWIEIKVLEGHAFTSAQIETFPLMSAKGVGIWILTDSTDDEMNKLFRPANWWQFLSTTTVSKTRKMDRHK